MSLRAIARELGISATAVSLAMKNSPRVSPELGARIRKMAAERGYVPNARISELMGEVRKAVSPAYHATLGAFSLYPDREPWKRPTREYLKLLLESASACAHEHGYRLEYFWYKEPGMHANRFRGILEARGIQGLLCIGSLDPEEQYPEALAPFAVTTFGASIPGNLHRVSSHFASDARLLFKQLLDRGYERPGLAILVHGDRRTDYAYSATYLSMLERQFPLPHTPVLRSDTWDEDGFHHWFSRNQPDVVVLHQSEDYVLGVENYLKKRGLRVPGDIGIALLDKNPNPARFSGVCQDHALMGITCIEMLIGRILLRDFTLPEHPKVELVCGTWNEGRTLRAPKRRARS
jgi:LacI family transcriptional regulator